MTERRRLRLKALQETFAVCRLAPESAMPTGLDGGALFAMVRTAGELSMVCDERRVPQDVRAEKGWKCLAVEGPLAFSETGILASVAGPLAEAGISIFAISTFDTDYVLVRAVALARAQDVLEAAGHDVER
jgi:hypothetical protein